MSGRKKTYAAVNQLLVDTKRPTKTMIEEAIKQAVDLESYGWEFPEFYHLVESEVNKHIRNTVSKWGSVIRADLEKKHGKKLSSQEKSKIVEDHYSTVQHLAELARKFIKHPKVTVSDRNFVGLVLGQWIKGETLNMKHQKEQEEKMSLY